MALLHSMYVNEAETDTVCKLNVNKKVDRKLKSRTWMEKFIVLVFVLPWKGESWRSFKGKKGENV